MVEVNVVAKGVSLIESMVAILVFFIAALGWISLEANLAKAAGTSRAIAQAVFVGQSKIDVLKQIPYEDLASSEEEERFDASGQPDPNGFYGINWKAVGMPQDAPTRQEVQMTVTWNLDATINDSVELYFMRSQ